MMMLVPRVTAVGLSMKDYPNGKKHILDDIDKVGLYDLYHIR
jgi:hypothetical protein